jgi:hypothetical protein
MGGQPAIVRLLASPESNSGHTVERIGQLPMMDKMGDVEDLVQRAVSPAAAAGTKARNEGGILIRRLETIGC